MCKYSRCDGFWVHTSSILISNIFYSRRRCFLRLAAVLGEPSDGQIVNDLLDLLHVILEGVELLPQHVVLQIEKAKPRVDVVHELGNPLGTIVVAVGH